MKTTVIFHKETGKVLAIAYDETWVIPADHDVRVFEEEEPTFTEIGDGEVTLDEVWRERPCDEQQYLH